MLFASNVTSETRNPLEVQSHFGPAAYISSRAQRAIMEREAICVYMFSDFIHSETYNAQREEREN